ncbi:hypothetical protein F4859DRAFT_436607 [Xylaria cf. heliscus]|nr:hypothetical protein F4859DRAFT_436607 [Xylaria cf. heliscus]
MKVQTAARFWGIFVATGARAQGDDIPDLIADGPFALRVKGVASSSSIDGYLHTTDVFAYPQPPLILHYDPSRTPVADNSSYRFYFNYTGNMQTEGHELGFFVSDITAGEPNDVGLLGKALSLQYRPNTNVAVPAFGASGSTVDLTGFDQDNGAFLDYYTDDSLTVPNKPANVSVDMLYYNWALCWQTYYGVTAQTLSWVTAGGAHNPTCEQVHLIKAEL